jgi:hypothetical protein
MLSVMLSVGSGYWAMHNNARKGWAMLGNARAVLDNAREGSGDARNRSSPTAGSVGNLDAAQMRSPCTQMHFNALPDEFWCICHHFLIFYNFWFVSPPPGGTEIVHSIFYTEISNIGGGILFNF